MSEIRIGLFGLGHRGVHWLRLLQRIPGYKVTAIGDMFPALHERGAADLVDPRGVAKLTPGTRTCWPTPTSTPSP